MSKKIENKDLPAFATSSPSCKQYDGHLQEGLTKREYFVAMAMQGLCASHISFDNIPKCAIKIADEVLELLNNHENPTS